MLHIILFIILAVSFGYFATQNNELVSISLANINLLQLPLYIVIGITLLIGLFFSWILSSIDSFSTFLKLRGKENKIKDSKKVINELIQKVNNLEIENAKLHGQLQQ